MSDLKDELDRSSSVSVGVDALPGLKWRINRVYQTLYARHDWPHLRKWFDKTLNAGQQYYDFPSGLNFERIEQTRLILSGVTYRCPRGINLEDYYLFDPAADERSDPVQKWDIRWTGSAGQIEVWPLPVTTQTWRAQGIQAISRLVNDSDLCLLDDTMVVLYAAHPVLRRQGSEDADDVLAAAMELESKLIGRTKNATLNANMAGGRPDPQRNRATIVVAS